MPLVSIITPALNAAPVLSRTIESVQMQSFTDWELIVVDDGSMDSTISTAERVALQDDRIRIIRLAEHSGTPTARNKGMDSARGRYTAFLNAGDTWLPNKLEEQLDFMAHHKAMISCTAWRRMRLGSIRNGFMKKPPQRITFNSLLRYDPVHASTVMIDHDLAGKVRFDPQYVTHANLALWLDMTKSGYDIHGYNQDLMRASPLRPRQYRTVFYRAWYLWQVYRHVAGLRIRATLGMMGLHAIISLWKKIF